MSVAADADASMSTAASAGTALAKRRKFQLDERQGAALLAAFKVRDELPRKGTTGPGWTCEHPAIAWLATLGIGSWFHVEPRGSQEGSGCRGCRLLPA